MSLMNKFVRIENKSNGRVHVYIGSLKIFSYKKSISKKDIKKIQHSYEAIISELKRKYKNHQKIKITFCVGLGSMFPAKNLMTKLQREKEFSVTILVIPDFRFGKELAAENQKKCLEDLKDYSDIVRLVPVNEEDDHINLNDIADIMVFPFTYNVSHQKYHLVNIAKKGILPILINYGMYNTIHDRFRLIPSREFALFWRIFVDEKYSVEEFKNFALLKDHNVFMSGYSKMDGYINSINHSKRKHIMIAPHHSIEGGFNDLLCLSNFLKYADFFLELPDMYPNIDFIYRPHPALLSVLKRENFWGEKRTDTYMKALSHKRNVKVSLAGDYFQDFNQSDGLIEDCASFLTEYFYTEKPQCYMLKKAEDIDTKFIPLGQECLKNCYLAYQKEDILNFINNVILKNIDPKKKDRIKFARTNVKVNYPNASEKIIEHLKECLS